MSSWSKNSPLIQYSPKCPFILHHHSNNEWNLGRWNVSFWRSEGSRAHISTWKFSFAADFFLHFQLKFLICSWFFFISSLLLHFLLPFLCSLYVYCNILAYFTQKRNSQFSRSRFSKPWSQICFGAMYFGESFAPFSLIFIYPVRAVFNCSTVFTNSDDF